MEIRKEKTGKHLNVALIGKMDGRTAPVAEAELLPYLNGVESLTLDLTDLEYVSSAGLRVFVKLMKMMDKRDGMNAIHVRPAVMEVFRTVMFDKIMNIS